MPILFFKENLFDLAFIYTKKKLEFKKDFIFYFKNILWIFYIISLGTFGHTFLMCIWIFNSLIKILYDTKMENFEKTRITSD